MNITRKARDTERSSSTFDSHLEGKELFSISTMSKHRTFLFEDVQKAKQEALAKAHLMITEFHNVYPCICNDINDCCPACVSCNTFREILEECFGRME